MNKGEVIRHLIVEGLDNQAILNNVQTTINSIRWHRSKMKSPTAPYTATSKIALSVGLNSVGAVVEKFGYAEIILTGLKRLNVKNAEDIFKILGSWKFKTNGRAQSRYGQCDYRARTLEVHEKLLEFADDFKMTFLHEVAHALDFLISGRSSRHGDNWKQVMIALDRDPRRCGGHSRAAFEALQNAKVNVRRLVETWVCQKCGREESIFKKRKYPASNYRHIRCGGNYEVKE